MALKALGVHIYMGAMSQGVSQFAEVPFTAESWSRAVWARSQINSVTPHYCKTCSLNDAVGHSADFVFANPPCSRYSQSSFHAYSDNDRRSLDAFPDLKEVIAIVAATDSARAMWWETGPLLWNYGMDMVLAVQSELEEIWDDTVTSVVVRIDPRYIGVPQRRQRNHVLHFKGIVRAANQIPESMWPPSCGVGAWLAHQMEDRWGLAYPVEKQLLCAPKSAVGQPWFSASKVAMAEFLTSSFVQTTPSDISYEDAYAPTVLSGRTGYWIESDRWLTAEEWAAIMTVNPFAFRTLAESCSEPKDAITLLSKGVMPDVAEFVGKTILQPMLAGDIKTRDDKWHDTDVGVQRLDLSTPGGPKRRWFRDNPFPKPFWRN